MSVTTLEKPTTPADIRIDALPYPTGEETWGDFFETIGDTLIDGVFEKVEHLLQQEPPSYKEIIFGLVIRNLRTHPFPGWNRLGGEGFEKLPDIEQLPKCMVLDFEATQIVEDGQYYPFLCFVWGDDGFWYVWVPQDDNDLPEIVEFPQGRIVIGHNVVSYDRKLLACEYSAVENYVPTIFIDTRALAISYCGLSSQMEAVYKKYEQNVYLGKGVPLWFKYASNSALDSLLKNLLGLEISKTVRDEMGEKLAKDYNFFDIPKDVLEYCAQDVWATWKLLKHFYRKARNFMPSSVSWYGMFAVSQMRVYLKDYDEFIERNEKQYQENIKIHAEFVKSFADEVLEEARQDIREGRELYRKWYEKAISQLKNDWELVVDIEDFTACNTSEQVFIEFFRAMGAEIGSKGEVSCCSLEFRCKTLFGKTGWKKALSDKLAMKGKLLFVLDKVLEKERAALEKSLELVEPSDAFQSIYPFDWHVKQSGDNQGKFNWYCDLEQREFRFGTRDTVMLLGLKFKGERIFFQNFEANGKHTGSWRTESELLPHPEGEGKFLNDVFCTDYGEVFESGAFTSSKLTQDQLIDFHSRISSGTQWKSYRTRYQDVYRVETPEGLMTTGDIVPRGTVTGRVTSNLWVVAPKPNKRKIGSEIMKQMVAPRKESGEPYVLKAADFDSQELMLAAVLTDAQVGEHNSSTWSKAVLTGVNTGDLATASDLHSIVARDNRVGRTIAKNLNFGSQYGAGWQKLADMIFLNSDMSRPEADRAAKGFLEYLKGGNGIAKSTFRTISRYADTPDVTTAVLRVRVPNTCNQRYVRKEFFTTRNNFQIQSGCADILHAFLSVLRALCIEYEVRALLLLTIHDAVIFAVEPHQEDLFELLMQRAHWCVMELVYERARERAIGHVDHSFHCPEYRRFFSSVDTGKNVAEALGK